LEQYASGLHRYGSGKLVVKGFKKTGVSNPCDGTEDHFMWEGTSKTVVYLLRNKMTHQQRTTAVPKKEEINFLCLGFVYEHTF
jgi:hypothetical protein